MIGVIMAGEKKPKPTGEKEKYSATIKLRPEFKEALEGVAKDLGLLPGQFVEDRLGQLVRAEWKRILTEKLKKAQQG